MDKAIIESIKKASSTEKIIIILTSKLILVERGELPKEAFQEVIDWGKKRVTRGYPFRGGIGPLVSKREGKYLKDIDWEDWQKQLDDLKSVPQK